MTGRFARMPENMSGSRIMARALFASTSTKLAIVCAGLGEPRNRYHVYVMAKIVVAYFYRRIEKSHCRQ